MESRVTGHSKIVIGNALAQMPKALKALAGERAKFMVIADAAVANSYGRRLRSALERAGFEALLTQVPSGESSKSLQRAGRLYRALSRARFERGSWLIALGGGVVGDLAGFVAATYLRGVPFVQAPTTLLAQVDASIGGKTGVDIPEGKNLVGAFYMPRLVWIDPALLQSLPKEDWRNGLAEVIKYGAIRDARLLGTLEAKIETLRKGYSAAWVPIIRRCAAIKAGVVRRDPCEKTGLRAILNFGHTVGHAIEAIAGYREYHHGEAVSIGMFVAGAVSQQMGLLKLEDWVRLRRLLTKAALPVQVKKPMARERIMEFLARDKKVRDRTVRFVLLKGLGNAVADQPVPPEILARALSASGL
jgi:3-dehydroquinate synthase